MEEVPAREHVALGIVAGWPTAEQFERAAHKALERARVIRENEANSRTRRTPSNHAGYYKNADCKAPFSNAPDCICWWDEFTGPLRDAPNPDHRTWRKKPFTSINAGA